MWFIIFIQFLLMLAMVILTINLISLIIATRTGAPYVPSRATAIAAMVKLADAKRGMRIAELGSGDGRVVRALAQHGAEVDGYEIQPLLAMWSRWLNRMKGLSDRTHIFRRNLYSVNYSQYDTVVIYGFPNMMQRLGEKFAAEMQPGSRIVSHAFAIPGWVPDQKNENVYLYRIKDPKNNTKPTKKAT
jgi:cyclopropane fatty-acyl-phospholipid synthase-like methyltransferase